MCHVSTNQESEENVFLVLNLRYFLKLRRQSQDSKAGTLTEAVTQMQHTAGNGPLWCILNTENTPFGVGEGTLR